MEKGLKNVLKNLKLNESLLSMVLGALTILVVGVLVFNFYRQARGPEITDVGESTEVTVGVTEKVGDVSIIEKDGEKFAADLPDAYTVVAGDHLWSIAERHYGSGYNWVDIAELNELQDAGVLLVGQELKLPQVPVKQATVVNDPATTLKLGQTVIEGTEYTVSAGDNLWDISVRAYQDGYRWVEIAESNSILNPDYIEVGQVIKLAR